MSADARGGDLEIRSGGVIAVDTADLRHGAAGLTALAVACDDVRTELRRAAAHLIAAGSLILLPSGLVDEIAELAAATAVDLRSLADVYELVEAEAQRMAALDAGDLVAAEALGARRHASPDEIARAAELTRQWRHDIHAELQWQYSLAALSTGPLTGLLGVIYTAEALAIVRGVGLGAVPGHARLRGAPQPVALRVLRRDPAATAPATLADITRRVPGDAAGRVRVERYTMADGSRQFAAYIAGTRATGDDDEPFDMTSNLQLYTGTRSASYEATVAALRASGAAPGDVVHLTGHSQGAMIASRLALEEEFDVGTVITLGTPVQADVGEDTLQITLRHIDDAVQGLDVGGFAHGTGAPGSFVAERIAHPRATLDDFTIPAHHIGEYTETAEMLDASSDPRMGAVRDRLAALGAAASVTAVVYGAERRPAPEGRTAKARASSSGGAG